MVGAARRWLEVETQQIRAGLRDAEAWLAKKELDAALTHEVEAAEAMLEIWRQSWEDHVELCRLFAEYADRVYAAERAKARELFGLRV